MKTTEMIRRIAKTESIITLIQRLESAGKVGKGCGILFEDEVEDFKEAYRKEFKTERNGWIS